MTTKLLTTLLLLLAAEEAVELPRIGCWREKGDGGAIRALYGIAGNLVARSEDACENEARFSEPDTEGVRTLRLNPHWRLAENASGERFLLHKGERHELPQ